MPRLLLLLPLMGLPLLGGSPSALADDDATRPPPPTSQPECVEWIEPEGPITRPPVLTHPRARRLYAPLLAGDREAVSELAARQRGLTARSNDPKEEARRIVERDELALLFMLHTLKQRKVLQAHHLALTIGQTAATGDIGQIAKRYAYLLEAYPEGGLDRKTPDGVTQRCSLAWWQTYLAAVNEQAAGRAGQGDRLLIDARSARTRDMLEWDTAWEKFRGAEEAYRHVELLAPDKMRLRGPRLTSAKAQLIARGLQLLHMAADDAKEQLVRDLGELQRSGTGQWGPPLKVKAINEQIESILKLEAKANDLITRLAASRPDEDKEILRLREQADQIDQLTFPPTPTGKKQHQQMDNFFDPPKPDRRRGRREPKKENSADEVMGLQIKQVLR